MAYCVKASRAIPRSLENLTHWCEVMHILDSKLDQYCFRWLLFTCSAPSHLLNTTGLYLIGHHFTFWTFACWIHRPCVGWVGGVFPLQRVSSTECLKGSLLCCQNTLNKQSNCQWNEIHMTSLWCVAARADYDFRLTKEFSVKNYYLQFPL